MGNNFVVVYSKLPSVSRVLDLSWLWLLQWAVQCPLCLIWVCSLYWPGQSGQHVASCLPLISARCSLLCQAVDPSDFLLLPGRSPADLDLTHHMRQLDRSWKNATVIDVISPVVKYEECQQFCKVNHGDISQLDWQVSRRRTAVRAGPGPRNVTRRHRNVRLSYLRLE